MYFLGDTKMDGSLFEYALAGGDVVLCGELLARAQNDRAALDNGIARVAATVQIGPALSYQELATLAALFVNDARYASQYRNVCALVRRRISADPS